MNKKIILPITIILIFVSIFIAFKFFHKECVQPEIVIDLEKPVQGQTIKFKCNNADESDNIVWDFGDTSSFKGGEATHKFKIAGTYTIKATRDENCTSTKEITILPKRKIQWVTPQINFQSEIHVNEPVTFVDETNEANIWNWKIPETQEEGFDKSFNTKFNKSGRYTITLNLKGNNIKGDTSFAIDVLDGVATKSSKTNTIAETPKIVNSSKPEIKKESKLLPVTSKTKPEPIIAKVEPVSKPEPVSKSDLKPKIEPKIKPVTNIPTIISDTDFQSSFVAIANALANEDDNASNEWRDKIVPATGDKGTMKVIIRYGAQVLEKSLESFKKTQLISSEPYKVESVKEIKRVSKNGPIVEITIVVGNK